MDHFHRYLKSRFEKELLLEMPGYLEVRGLSNHAAALQQYCDDGSISRNPWTSGTCQAGFQLPVSAQYGDIWLDLADFTPFVYVPKPDDTYSDDVISWMALYPVQNWQYAAFCKIVQWENTTNEHAQLDLDRTGKVVQWFDHPEISPEAWARPATGMLGNAAAAYAAWFQRILLDDSIDYATEFLPEDLVRKMAPEGLRLWGHGTEPGWIAWHEALLEYEIEEIEASEDTDLSDSVFGPFETADDVGFSTRLFRFGLSKPENARLVYPYIYLKNWAERPM